MDSKCLLYCCMCMQTCDVGDVHHDLILVLTHCHVPMNNVYAVGILPHI